MSDVSFASYNVNGLRNVEKRREVFNYLKSTKSQINLLQETHSCSEDERVWSNEWGNKIIFSHRTNSARGVAILIDKKASIGAKVVYRDVEGRYLIIELDIANYKFLLVNVYAPNEDHPYFFTKLFEDVDNCYNDSMLLAGDFNTSLDESIDLFNNKGLNHLKRD